MRDDFLWVEKYRPRTVDDTILSPEMKDTFKEFIKQGNIPNLLLSGGAGMGKTTVARAMLEELGCDYIIINGSMNGNIDTLRNDIRNFASTVSFDGGRKYVILDEADYLNAQSTQPALRNFMEEFSNNCGFILTCNFANRIISPLHSRCSVIEFKIPNSEKPKLAAQLMKRIQNILSQENIEYDEQVVAQVIMKHFPDFRRVLNELQRYSATGKIDTGILVNLVDVSIKSLMQHMKDRNFKEVRKWVVENIDNDPVMMYRKLYDSASEYLKPESVPSLVLIVAEYSYKSAFVADQEVNLVACLTEIMSECAFS